jgi:hypothetical protein|tara:strand:+ start:9890 stop:11302 length:1413 start_codon:yes stop_codon:yes gene_type:complete
MGLFKSIKKGLSSLARGVRKVVKKVGKATGLDGLIRRTGRAIKSGLAKFGKFMDSIGIIGQIAVSLMLPAIGSALLKSVGFVTNTLAGVKGTTFAAKLARGVAKVGQFVTKSVSKVGNVYRNVTKGVTETITNFSKTLGNKIASVLPDGKLKSFFANSGPENFFAGKDSAYSKSFGKAGRLNYKNLAISEDQLLDKIAEVDFEIAQAADPNAVARQSGDILTKAKDGSETILNLEDIKNSKGETIFKNTLEIDPDTGLRKFSPSKGDFVISDTSGREFFADADAIANLSDLQVSGVKLTDITDGAFKFNDVSEFKNFLGGEDQKGFFGRLNEKNPFKSHLNEEFKVDGKMIKPEDMTFKQKLVTAPSRAVHGLVETAVAAPANLTYGAVKDSINLKLQDAILDPPVTEVTNYSPSPAVATGQVYTQSSYSGDLPSYQNYVTDAGAYGYNAHRYAQDSWNTYSNYRQTMGI